VTGPRDEARRGLALGIAAYAFWGVVPLYWRLLRHVDAVEILAHRTVWGIIAFAILAAAFGVGPAIRAALRDRRALIALAVSGALLAVNWGVFIHAVATDHLLDASLGYFINPLVSVLLGMVVLGERLRRLQWAALALAAAGVAQVALARGGLPWIALVLAASFGLYGLLRKTAPVDALAGSTIETGFIAPLGAGYLVYLAATGGGALGHVDGASHALLALTGLVTALPLVWFTAAARRLPLSTVGFLQYLAPTGQFLSAVLIFREPFAARELAAFVCIWAGLVVFSIDLWRRRPPGPSRMPGKAS
jgi:chloramphenicol-sensitive protein RarD